MRSRSWPLLLGSACLLCATGARAALPDLAVGDGWSHAVLHVDRATGDRSMLSGCVDASCSSETGSGPRLGNVQGLIEAPDGSLVVCDERSVFGIDSVSAQRRVISGCADAPCSTVVGSGITLVDPADAAVAGASLLVTDFHHGDGYAAVVSVDPVTGNRTTLSGCADDACSSVVGAGRNLVGSVAIVHTASGRLYVVDRGLVYASSPAALFEIDPVTGNRTVISGCIDAGCTSIAGAGVALSVPSGVSAASDGSLLVADLDLGAVFRVDPITGDRDVVSGCNHSGPCGGPPVGGGPAFGFPLSAIEVANGEILVSDLGARSLLRVDPITGNRSVVSSNSLGNGPTFTAPSGLVELPEPAALPAFATSTTLVAWLAARRRALPN